MNIKEIKEMISIMKENDITEFEMEKDGFKVKLRKGADFTVSPENIMVKQQPVQYIAEAPTQQSKQGEGTSASSEAEDDPNVEIVRSPMVGTFYQSAAPDADPFVTAGQTIHEGDTLCIIEAMKLMNEIKAEFKGKVIEILVENGQSVEFDQPLFKIKK
ncbi:acetyl-CoA carboxylase biotin carboxyl carrier protein [Candidatus Omnitrophota bacterium]